MENLSNEDMQVPFFDRKFKEDLYSNILLHLKRQKVNSYPFIGAKFEFRIQMRM